jgi:hypothetical protein
MALVAEIALAHSITIFASRFVDRVIRHFPCDKERAANIRLVG